MVRRQGHFHGDRPLRGRGGGRNVAVFAAVWDPNGARAGVRSSRLGRVAAPTQPGSPGARLENDAPVPQVVGFPRVLWPELFTGGSLSVPVSYTHMTLPTN